MNTVDEFIKLVKSTDVQLHDLFEVSGLVEKFGRRDSARFHSDLTCKSNKTDALPAVPGTISLYNRDLEVCATCAEDTIWDWFYELRQVSGVMSNGLDLTSARYNEPEGTYKELPFSFLERVFLFHLALTSLHREALQKLSFDKRTFVKNLITALEEGCGVITSLQPIPEKPWDQSVSDKYSILDVDLWFHKGRYLGKGTSTEEEYLLYTQIQEDVVLRHRGLWVVATNKIGLESVFITGTEKVWCSTMPSAETLDTALTFCADGMSMQEAVNTALAL